MAILSKPLGQQTRRDIILRLRKENEKETYEQKQTEQEDDHTLFPLLEETTAPIVCALKVIISSHWFSQSLIHWFIGFFLIRIENETSKSITIYYRKDPHQRDH